MAPAPSANTGLPQAWTAVRCSRAKPSTEHSLRNSSASQERAEPFPFTRVEAEISFACRAENPGWIRAFILADSYFFIFVLFSSAVFNPKVGLLPFPQAFTYVAVIFLSRRDKAWGYGDYRVAHRHLH